MKFQSLDELISFFQTMPVQKTWQVGMTYQNHSRAVYQIGLVQILIDTVFPYNVFKPSEEWYWTGDGMTKAEAKRFAKQYNAIVEESYYPTDKKDEYQLLFDKLNDLLHWLFDNRKKELEIENKS